MTFESKIDWPEFISRLPTRHGDAQGPSTENRMLAKTPASGIHTQMQSRQDGSVTMLRTRNGWPEFTTISPKAEIPLPALRGFVARLVSATSGLLFWPVDMLQRAINYRPVGHGYYVAPFATPHNASAAEGALWHDVWTLTSEGKFLVNAKVYTGFGGIAPVSGMADALPYLIPKAIGDYGGLEDNAASVKRVFAVGRTRVLALTDGATAPPSVDLWPETPRDDGKAIVCGAAIDRTSHDAWLSQLYYTGATASDLSGSWVFSSARVALLLAPPYLSKTDAMITVDQGALVPVYVTSTYEQIRPVVTLPPAQVALEHTGEMGAFAAHAQRVNFRATSVVSRALAGEYVTGCSAAIYLSEASTTTDIMGEAASIHSNNEVRREDRSEQLRGVTQVVDLPPPSPAPTVSTNLYLISGNFVWDATSSPNGPRGASGVPLSLGALGQTTAYYTADIQSGDFGVSVAEDALVSGAFSRRYETGGTVVAHPTKWLEQYLGDIDGMGRLTFAPASNVLNAAISLGRVDEMDALLITKGGEWVGSLYYNYVYSGIQVWYTTSIEPRLVADASLTWTTRDFVLLDKNEDVRICVRGEFAGSQSYGQTAGATLSVYLDIESRFGNASRLLFETPLTYLELLPREVLTGAVQYVPSPQLRLLYTPLHREQGEFRGAAYTTIAEQAAGAVPACLVNFVLGLGAYEAIGTDDNPALVRLIPCNLLEMLYAYVFSQKYGRDENERYPVQFASRFDDFMGTLFSDQWRISYRDGVFVDWLDTFGGQYETQENQQIYRT